jgi:15-cis-phytoene synthase
MRAICPNRDNARSKVEVNAEFAMIRDMQLPPLRDEIRMLGLNFAPLERRSALHALWALDEALGQVVRSTTEPMIGQMRLTWWHERLSAIGDGAPPAEPVLVALAREMPDHGAALAAMIEGWEALLDPMPLDDVAIAMHASARGGRMFALCADLLNDATNVHAAGDGWAAMDFALHCSDKDTARRAQSLARERVADGALPKAKALRVLARVSRRDAARPLGVPRSKMDVLRATLF